MSFILSVEFVTVCDSTGHKLPQRLPKCHESTEHLWADQINSHQFFAPQELNKKGHGMNIYHSLDSSTFNQTLSTLLIHM